MTSHSTLAGWQRSSHCGNGACVEIATDDAHRYMRDAKEHQSPILAFSNAAWDTFIGNVKNGQISAK